MCACEPGFFCSRCTGDPRQDARVLIEGDEPTREEREQAEADRLWREQIGVGMVGRVW